MKRTILALAIAAAAAVVATTAVASSPFEGNPAVQTALAQARAATARFHDADAAIAAGYIRVSDCVAAPGLGAMGYHYLNPAYAADPAIDAAKPEALVYAPRSNGGVRLVAVEYVKADADQDLSTDGDRPSLAGVAFDGPMPGHTPGQPVHYDLHAWVWADNPSGTFAQFNPSVSC